jgi:YVTN family beta-propeller protein
MAVRQRGAEMTTSGIVKRFRSSRSLAFGVRARENRRRHRRGLTTKLLSHALLVSWCQLAFAGAVQDKIASVVYLSRIVQGQVAVIDVQSDTIIRLLPTGTNPAEIGVIEALERACVADLGDGTVTVVNTTSHRVVGVVPLSGPVAAVGVDEAAHRVYVVDFSNGSAGTDLHVIDAENLVELGTHAVGSRTQNIAVSADHNVAYITDFVEGVIEVDTTSGAVLRTVPMAGLPHGVAVDEDAGLVYVTRLESDSVAVIDAANLTVIDVLAVGDVPQWIALDALRNKGFVTNEGDGSVSVFDTTTHTVHPAVIQVGDDPLTLVIHEGAAKAYVYTASDGNIVVIDTFSETVLATLSVLFANGFESGDAAVWGGAVDG